MDEGSSAFMNPVLLLHTRNLYISQSLRTELDIYASRVGAAAAVKVRRQLLLFGVVSGFRREGGGEFLGAINTVEQPTTNGYKWILLSAD